MKKGTKCRLEIAHIPLKEFGMVQEVSGLGQKIKIIKENMFSQLWYLNNVI
jgi:hypothetical protein